MTLGWTSCALDHHLSFSHLTPDVTQSGVLHVPCRSMLRCAEEHSTRCIRKAVAVSARQSRWRFASTSTKSGTSTIATKLSSRWLSDVKERLGKCITFGLSAEQKQEVGRILHTISQDWRSLVAGSEGFLTSRERCGMFRYPIAWGEQDPMVRLTGPTACF